MKKRIAKPPITELEVRLLAKNKVEKTDFCPCPIDSILATFTIFTTAVIIDSQSFLKRETIGSFCVD
jgi:hypothetical protein